MAGALLGAWLAMSTPAAPRSEASGLAVRPVALPRAGASAWAGGERVNVAIGGDGLRLEGDSTSGQPVRSGFFVSAVELAESTFDQIRARLDSGDGEGGRVELDVRTSVDGRTWSAWTPLPTDGSPADLAAGRLFQYRAELLSEDGRSPVLRGLSFELASTGAAPSAARADNPTVRLFATREGLVGRKTANGHQIVERDRFVALPSKRVLNPLDKRNYEVRLSYKGKTTTAPVWDVGPWNTKDNYWDEQRELFGDLPRFVPQALAAWRDDHNDGRDQFNRWVSFPASIDLADGTFIDDLGMRNSDWVDVTFLWLRADSPPKAEAPPVTGLKPEPKGPAPLPDGATWFFAEGNTKTPFETWFILYNPGAEASRAVLTYTSIGGGSQRQEVVVEPAARTAVYANQVIPDSEFITRIDSSRPLLATRSTYFGGDGHASAGSPAPATTWYLAEGSTQPPFDTWILVDNPGASAANVNLTFMKDGGENQTVSLSVPPGSRRDIRTNEHLPAAAFSTKVTSDQPVVVERTVYLDNGGGGHSTTAAPSTAKSWYFAEGSTKARFDTWVLIQNPNRGPAAATVTLLRESGPPVEQKVVVGAMSRAAINARALVAGERFGIKVEADQPVVAERAMYFGGTSEGRGTGAHASVGAPELARSWILPEGSTEPPWVEQVLAANPNAAPARLKVEFVVEGAGTVARDYSVPAQGRLTIDANAEVPNAAILTRVSSDQPIVVERSTYFNNGSGGTNALGIAR